MNFDWKPISTAPKGDAHAFFVKNMYGEIEIAWTNWNMRPGVRTMEWEEPEPYSIFSIPGHGVRIGSLLNFTHWAKIPIKDDSSTETGGA